MDGETSKMKVVDFEKLWNFVVDNFFIKIILSTKTKFEFLKFEIQTLKTTSNGETTKWKL